MKAHYPAGSNAGRATAFLAFVAIILVCGISARFHARIDMSADRINTPGPILRTLAVQIPEKLRITYFVSPILAQRDPGPSRIEDYLYALAAISRDRISLEIVDPARMPKEALQAGLGSGTISIIEKNQSRQSIVQSGILFEYLNRSKVIPFILDAANLETAVSRTIRALIEDRDPEIAILIGDTGKSLDGDFSLLKRALESALWKIVELRPGEKVPDSASLLLVLGNADIGDAAVVPIREWLVSGRSAFFAVKGVDVRAGDDVSAVRLESSAVLALLSTCGVQVGRSLVLDHSALTVPFQGSDAAGDSAINYYLYPHWIMVRPENSTRSGGMIPESGGLDLFWPSPLFASGAPGTEFRPLIMTGKSAWLQTKNFVVRPGPIPDYEAELEATRGQYTLAASVRVSISSHANPGNIIVVGSSDFASDLSAMTGSAFNTDFVLKVVDIISSPLSGGLDAAGMGRAPGGVRERRFTKVESPKERDSLVLANYIVNLVLVPAFILTLGFAHVAGRKRTRENHAPAVKSPDSAVMRS